ncbi:MAG: LysR family transcriptional regulator, partial [Planctomycetota bacterium]
MRGLLDRVLRPLPGAEVVGGLAIGQQVRRLERELGIALLTRSGRGVAPTAGGAALALALGDAFQRMSD